MTPPAPEAPVPTTPAPTEPAAAAPQTPAPPADSPASPAPEAPAEPAPSPWDNPIAAKAEIEKLRKENGAARTTAKAQAAEEARTEFAQTIGKALGLIKDDQPADPAALTQQATDAATEAKQAKVALAVYKASKDVGDPVALLDSTSFLAKVNALDPSDDAAITAAIAEAVAANPRLGAVPVGPPEPRVPQPNPAQGSSGGGAPDIQSLIAAATKAGDLNEVIRLENQKLLHLPQN